MVSLLHRCLVPLRVASLFALVILTACASTPSPVLQRASPLGDSRQMVLVLTDNWTATTGSLQRFERRDGQWQAVGSAASIAVGRSGTGWGSGLHPAQAEGPQKQEGDGRAPAGVFALGDAFGYAAHDATRMPYRPMQASHYCMDVPASPYYNRIIDTRELGEAAAKGSTEPMRLDLHSKGDPRYRKGLVIEHNTAAVPRAGSCIFAHLWRTPGEPTAGCTAMAAETMDDLLAWLQPQEQPLLVLLPRAEYERVAGEWKLPRAGAAR
jgi:L,D-peptidoglycan transpeptidase YkuD (ErfK/YbiS/YcfS/YnhG family)